MSEKLEVICFNAQQAYRVLSDQVWPFLKAMLSANHRMVVIVRMLTKSRAQEEHYHSLIGEIAAQAKHLGSKWEPEDWKRLLIDKFARETNKTGGKIIPNLDTSGVVEVGVLSRNFSVKDGADFITFLHAWGAENGITFKDEQK